jgi:flagellar FliL protein
MSRPAKPEAAAAEKSAKKSPKKFIMLALALIIVLGAGGAGAWFFLGSTHTEKLAHNEPPPAPVFINLEPFTVNLDGEDEDHYMQASIVLQVRDEKSVDRIKQYMPQIRSRLLMLLSSKKIDEVRTAAGKRKLAEEIVAAVKQPATTPATHEVTGAFFTDLVIQ